MGCRICNAVFFPFQSLESTRRMLQLAEEVRAFVPQLSQTPVNLKMEIKNKAACLCHLFPES